VLEAAADQFFSQPNGGVAQSILGRQKSKSCAAKWLGDYVLKTRAFGAENLPFF
jgi:hypothetical protein